MKEKTRNTISLSLFTFGIIMLGLPTLAVSVALFLAGFLFALPNLFRGQ